MTRPPKKPKQEEIETDPGSWGRFEYAVDAAVKSGPKPRKAKKADDKIVLPKRPKPWN